jgi:hypothetical protein
MDKETKICPHCGEEILAIAKKCKYCKQWIEQPATDENPAANPAPATAEEVAPLSNDEIPEEVVEEKPVSTYHPPVKVPSYSSEPEEDTDDNGSNNILPIIIAVIAIALVAFMIICARSSKSPYAASEETNVEEVVETVALADEDGKHNEDYIRQRVQEMYDSNRSDKEKAYTTEEYYSLYKQVQEINNNLRGEIGFEFYHWGNSQDPEHPVATVSEVKIAAYSDVATVDVDISDHGNNWSVSHILKFENGNWYVSDFKRNGIWEKKAMEDFISESKRSMVSDDATINMNGTWTDGTDYSGFTINFFEYPNSKYCQISDLEIYRLYGCEGKTLDGSVGIKNGCPYILMEDGFSFLFVAVSSNKINLYVDISGNDNFDMDGFVYDFYRK